MKIQLVTKPLSQIDTEYLTLPVFEESNLVVDIQIVKDFLKDNPKFGKLYETQLLYFSKQKLLLVGAGKKEEFDFEKLQNWAGTAVKTLLQKAKEVTLLPPVVENVTAERLTAALTIGAEIATHDLASEYKSKKEPTRLTSIQIVLDTVTKEHKVGLGKGEMVADAINLSRRLGDMPANEMTPSYFLSVAKKVAKENKLRLVVLNERLAKRRGMGAFVGVAQGSDEPSYMIALEYKGDSKSKDKWGIVGKGVTFDSGGISIKPGEGMQEMKYDMAGAAAILAAMQAISRFKVKANVVGVMAVTENLPSGKALKPGDILRTYCGKTAEILNTDAEGRVLLIDAVSFAQKDFKANKLVDLATLTGAIIVALGDFYTGAFGNDPHFTQDVISAASRVGEKIWQLPMSEEYDEMIKSELADITNIGHGGSSPRAAGSITGAKFIEAAVLKDNKWVHLDIAGTAWDMKPKAFRGVGATGVGVKTLIELISAS